MRRGIKIKAFAIFVCWLMIFTHSIIPHNHTEDDFEGFFGGVQSSVNHHNECDHSTNFHNQCEDAGACHISNFLFHKFNQDNLTIQACKSNNINFVFLTGQILFGSDQDFKTDDYFGSAALRAPPLT